MRSQSRRRGQCRGLVMSCNKFIVKLTSKKDGPDPMQYNRYQNLSTLAITINSNLLPRGQIAFGLHIEPTVILYFGLVKRKAASPTVS